MKRTGLIHTIIYFFDKLEDRVRGWLSRVPILYAAIGGVGVILFWRGVWHVTDTIDPSNGILSVIVGALLLLISGAFVSSLIGNRLILTGIRGEKKLTEMTQEEIETEESQIKSIKNTLLKVEERLGEIEKDVHRGEPHEEKKQ